MSQTKSLVPLDLAAPWGRVQVLRPIPRDGDCWGALSPLRETLWGRYIAVVSGEAFTHAMHGYIDPLMREMGPAPKHLLQRIAHQKDEVLCQLAKDRSCSMADQYCFPCSKVPECYTPEAPPASLVEDDTPNLILAVVLAWKEGRYVVVVNGKEFSR